MNRPRFLNQKSRKSAFTSGSRHHFFCAFRFACAKCGDAPEAGFFAVLFLALHLTGCQLAEDHPPPPQPSRPEVSLPPTASTLPPSIIPLPLDLERTEGVFRLSDAIHLDWIGPDYLASIAATLTDSFRDLTGNTLLPSNGKPGAQRIVLEEDPSRLSLGPEGYTLSITPNTIRICAPKPAGLFYGVQSLRQLLPLQGFGHSLPCLEIRDIPQFPWRSFMLDVSRHFFSIEDVKRYIDLLAHIKINVLHLHLTDDQGWRLASEKYPKLTTVGGFRNENGNRYGGFYTAAEMKDLVAYAADRYITILPEIDMPGHSQSALAAYPELSCTGAGPFTVRTDHTDIGDAVFCAGNPETYSFLFDVLEEVMDIFPSEYIHIGADEVSPLYWASCTRCQAMMQAHNLQDEKLLQGIFVDKISRYLTAHGRRMICWDDVLDTPTPADTTIMFWRTWLGPEQIQAAGDRGHPLILAPISHFYLSGEPPPEYVYNYTPDVTGLTGEARKRVLGGTAAVWTEAIPTTEKLERDILPGLWAFSEAVWTPEDRRDVSGFTKRMWHHYSLLEHEGVHIAIPSPDGYADRTFFSTPRTVQLIGPEIATLHYTLDGSIPTSHAPRYRHPIPIHQNTLLHAVMTFPNGEWGPVRPGVFIQRPRLQPVAPGRIVPGLRFRYYEGDVQSPPSFQGMALQREGFIPTFKIPDGTRPDSFMLEMRGLLRIEVSGQYRFYLRSDDGSRLWIGEECVVDNWGLRPLQTRSGQLYLEAGFYPLRAEFVEASGDEILDVFYERPDLSRREIPPTALFSQIESSRPTATSLPAVKHHPPDRAFDGDPVTKFWSARPPSVGDHFSLFFSSPQRVQSIRVLTGEEEDSRDSLQHGSLLISTNGIDFHPAGSFTEGIGEVHFTTPTPLQALQIQVTGHQQDWLVIREIQLDPFLDSNTP